MSVKKWKAWCYANLWQGRLPWESKLRFKGAEQRLPTTKFQEIYWGGCYNKTKKKEN